MRLDESLYKFYCQCADLVSKDENQLDFEFKGHSIKLKLCVAMDTTLKWTIWLKKGNHYNIIGAVNNLMESHVIINEEYINQISGIKNDER